MVRVHAGGDIGVELLALQARSMAVDLLVVCLGGHDLGYGVAVTGDDAGEIHHLRQTLHPGMVKKAVNVPVVQVGAAFVHRRSRHAGRQHKAHIHRKLLCGAEHIVDAVSAHYIGDLVGVGNYGGSAVGQHRPGKLRRGYQAAFQVDMGIDKAGANYMPGHIHFLSAFVAAQAYDQAFRYRNIPRLQFAAEHIHIGGVFQHQVCLDPPGSRIDDALLFYQLAPDLTRPALFVCHSPSSLVFIIWVIISRRRKK